MLPVCWALLSHLQFALAVKQGTAGHFLMSFGDSFVVLHEYRYCCYLTPWRHLAGWPCWAQQTPFELVLCRSLSYVSGVGERTNTTHTYEKALSAFPRRPLQASLLKQMLPIRLPDETEAEEERGVCLYRHYTASFFLFYLRQIVFHSWIFKWKQWIHGHPDYSRYNCEKRL